MPSCIPLRPSITAKATNQKDDSMSDRNRKPLSHEQQLVLNSIRLDQPGEDPVREILQYQLDWDQVLKIANYNQVLPHLYLRIRSHYSGLIPPEQLSGLKTAYQENARHNLRLAMKLIRFLDLLASRGIEAIAFKGPAMAIQAYGDLSSRQFYDLDILIHKRDMPRVYELLDCSGYTPEIAIGVIGPQRLMHANKDFHFKYRGDFFEVHGEIIEGAMAHPIQPEFFFQTIQSIEILGRKIQALSPENTLLMACIQATADRWDQLRWAADVSHLCQTSLELDWPGLFKRARQMGVFRLICVALQLAEDVGGVIFPKEIRTSYRSDMICQDIAAEVKSRLAPEGPVDHGIFGNTGFILQSRERLRDRLYYVLDQTFVPKQVDWIAFPLPDSLSAAYWVIRPIRLAAKFSLQVLAGHHRDEGIPDNSK
jgi:hypothetical protein